MKKIFHNEEFHISKGGFQDVIFLVGIFLFTSILVIGLFPNKGTGVVINLDFFVYAVMSVPVIAAIYFIVISFNRNLYSSNAEISSSIRKKMMLAFIFIAILPSLPIVLTANYLINQNLSRLISSKTSDSLNEAVLISHETKLAIREKLSGEIKSLSVLFDKRILTPETDDGRKTLKDIFEAKNIRMLFYETHKNGKDTVFIPVDILQKTSKDVTLYYSMVDFAKGYRIDELHIDGKKTMVGAFQWKKYFILLNSIVPHIIDERLALFNNSINDYNRLKYYTKFFATNSGVFLFILSIAVILISVLVSLYLSKSITRPVLTLSDAAKELASGNFNVKLQRKSNDELGVLFTSFNKMVDDLDHNRKLTYQKQRLEAWREMARRLVHEIKNPLTPIRFSAERMRKRFLENHPDIEEIILSGTDTIIEEVEVLMSILDEFTKFARLPEMKKEKMDINPILENSMNMFMGHEHIHFELKMDNDIPGIFLDKVLIRQAITNLIQNAVDAVGEQGNIEISSKIIQVDGFRHIQVVISDDGIGIRETDLERIFEPGFSRKTSGTGLGLAIVQKIINEHGGDIFCYSKYGEGTEFTIELPLEFKGV